MGSENWKTISIGKYNDQVKYSDTILYISCIKFNGSNESDKLE